MSGKKENILQATMDLLRNEAVHNVTMDEIAQHAGSSKMTVYKYFPDKDTLFFEVGITLLRGDASKLRSIVESSEALIEKMKRYLDVVCEFTDSKSQSLCKRLSRFNQKLGSEYAKHEETYRETMLTLIDEGIECGMLKPGLDRKMAYAYIDMGVKYYQNDVKYRNLIQTDTVFQKRFLSFFLGNIFDGRSL